MRNGMLCPHPQIISVDSKDSESEEEVTMENFKQFNRGIENIRTCARNSQLSRRQRREKVQRAPSASGSSLRPSLFGNVEVAGSSTPRSNPFDTLMKQSVQTAKQMPSQMQPQHLESDAE